MQTKDGVMVKEASAFRSWITSDGSSGFPAESGRYHLYVAYTCPFSIRTLTARALKGLESAVGITALAWHSDPTIGWIFTDKKRLCELDKVNGKSTLKEIYQMVDPEYPVRGSVPVLWDKVKKTIVSNDSGDIIQMFNREFNAFCATEKQKKLDLYPNELKEKIDEMGRFLEKNVMGGIYKVYHVYKPGTDTNEVPDQTVVQLFEAFDKIEAILEQTRFLIGNELTLADIRLFTSLIRFDVVYYGQMQLHKGKIVEYPNLWAYVRDICNIDGVSDTVDKEYIEKGYNMMMSQIDASEIIPKGVDLLDFSIPLERRAKFRVA